MQYWKVKAQPLSGHKYEEIIREVEPYIKLYRKSGNKKPFIRSLLFKKRKIFFDYFWEHLFSKPLKQRKQRIKLIPCGLELLKHSTIPATEKKITKKSSLRAENLLRCYGKTKTNRTFTIQVKETKEGNLQLMSMFWSEA